MKTIQLLFCLALVFAFASCKNKDKVQKEEQTQTQTEQKPPIDPNNSESDGVVQAETYRFHVSFYSIGQGIDNEMKQKFVDWLKSYPVVVAYEETPWGREGEVDFCFKLAELSAGDQLEFIKKAKDLLISSSLVHINENVPCSHKK